MPGTQRPYRPYFYNFLTAFRAHHAFRSAATPTSTTTPTSAFAQQQTQQQQASAFSSASSSSSTATATATSASAPWPIPSKSTPAAHGALSPTTGVSAAFSPPSTHHRHTHTTSAATPIGAPSGAAGLANGGGTRTGRRGSDASSDSGGFRERPGGEAWFVGGKTAAGEERFYRLGMVRRDRSGERASVDRMSL